MTNTNIILEALTKNVSASYINAIQNSFLLEKEDIRQVYLTLDTTKLQPRIEAALTLVMMGLESPAGVEHVTTCHETALLIVPLSALNVLGAEINTDREFSGGGRRYGWGGWYHRPSSCLM
jgi:hypothetical protein